MATTPSNDTVMSPTPQSHGQYLFNFSLSQVAFILQEHLLKDRIFSPITEAILISCYCFLMITGVASNVLITIVILTRRQIRTARNVYIVNLNITDLALCLFCMPFTLLELLRRSWRLQAILCKLVPFVQGSIIFVQAATVSAIALDRHWSIVSSKSPRNAMIPGRSGHLRTIFITLAIWIVSLTLSTPVYFSKTVISVGLPGFVIYRKCIEQWPSTFGKSVYTLVVTGAQFVIPATVLVVTHFRIKTHLRKTIFQTAHEPAETASLSRSDQLCRELTRNHRATMVLLNISIVFAISWLPWNILNVVADFRPDSMSPHNLYLSFAVCHILAMSSATTNAILYGWFNTNIRRELVVLRQRISSALSSHYRSSDNPSCVQQGTSLLQGPSPLSCVVQEKGNRQESTL